MPTYDYKCRNCGHTFEKFQPITASAMRKCPYCGKLKLKRLIGAGAGIIFRGNGFYQTDYRSSSYNKAAEKDKPSTISSKKTDQYVGADGAKSKSDPSASKSDN